MVLDEQRSRKEEETDCSGEGGGGGGGGSRRSEACEDGEDNDGDGLSNQAEFALDLDPEVSNGTPLVLDLTGAKAKATVNLNSSAAPEFNYSIERSTDFITWTTVGTTILTQTNSQLCIESNSPHNSMGKEFYRITVTPKN